jgi:hypothetical protein
MIRRTKAALAVLVALCLSPALVSQTKKVPSGTEIKVRTDQAINVKSDSTTNNLYPGTISKDVLDSGGQVVIPKGSRAQLAAVKSGDKKDQVALDLRSVTINGKRYVVTAEGASAAGSTKRGGLGANKRTGMFVGGGALAGTVLGGLAGGGKGALIGALAGSAAGAGAQVLTKGKELNVPAETELTFKLAQDMRLQPAGAGKGSSRKTLPPPQQ